MARRDALLQFSRERLRLSIEMRNNDDLNAVLGYDSAPMGVPVVHEERTTPLPLADVEHLAVSLAEVNVGVELTAHYASPRIAAFIRFATCRSEEHTSELQSPKDLV